MQAINRKGVEYDSLPTNVNDTALKRQFPSGPFGQVWLLHSRLRINVCFFSYFLSSANTNSVNAVRIHLALSGGPRDYIAQKELEPSPGSSQISHV